MLFALRLLGSVALSVGIVSAAAAVDLVKGGKPVATIVADSKPIPVVEGKGRAGKKKTPSEEGKAVQLLVDWVKKITDVELPVADKVADGQTAIYVGKAAIKAGLKLDDIVSPSKEGVRIVVEGNRVLIAGQNDEATMKGVARFLELLGCRYFMDGPLGEVFPRTKDLSVSPTSITEKPGLQYRNPKGPRWNAAVWKAWNGAGGVPFNHSHSWSSYLPKGLFQQHPEYFAMGADGKRHDGAWVCTSNPGLRQFFAEQVIQRVKAGNHHPSISPTDGRGYCQCPECKAQDDPNLIEPSSGKPAISNRYADFFDDIGKRVAKECPEAIVSFYAYFDYTQAPSFKDRKLSPNLVAVIAPIRYCRLHGIGSPNCPAQIQQLDMVDGWTKLASHLGYYNYMYNMADGALPMFKFTPCKTEFPYLADKGLMYMTIEVLNNWYVYGPQIYLSLRMAYDPKLDAAALMEDYFEKFYGPAAPFMKAYWMGIDEGMVHNPSHSGGLYGLAAIYTPEFMRACESRLRQAAEAAKANPTYAARVALHAAGFENVLDYREIEDAMAHADYPRAKKAYDKMIRRIDGLAAKQYANGEYGTSYLKQFLSPAIDGGLAATAAPNRAIKVLPDQWKVALDPTEQGEAKQFHAPDFDDSRWKNAATYSATLSAQGIETQTVLWYRTKVNVPDQHGPLALFFPEVQGKSVSVFVNGKLRVPTDVKTGAKSPGAAARRLPFEVDLGDAVRPGENTIAVRIDNRAVSEFFLLLGGFLRPVVLIEKGTK